MKFIFTAVPFGYGPISALNSVVSQLPLELKTKSTIILPKNLMSVISREKSFTYLTNIELTKPCMSSYLQKDIILVNFGNLEILQDSKINCRQIFVDCVGWLTPKFLQENVLAKKNVRYLIEYLPPLNEHSIPDFAKLVQPSLYFNFKKSKNCSSEILFTTGGGCIPNKTPQYNIIHKLTQSMIEKVSEKLPNYKINLFGGSSNSMSDFNESRPRTLPHKIHIKHIARSKIVITVPGLYTVFETLMFNKPIILLPPTNYTQVVQFNWYVQNGFVQPSMNWTNMLGLKWNGSEISREIDELQFIYILQKKIESNVELQQKIINNTVNCILGFIMRDNKQLLHRQKSITRRFVSTFCNKKLPTINDIILREYYEQK